jgi:hypothetical protein
MRLIGKAVCNKVINFACHSGQDEARQIMAAALYENAKLPLL